MFLVEKWNKVKKKKKNKKGERIQLSNLERFGLHGVPLSFTEK